MDALITINSDGGETEYQFYGRQSPSRMSPEVELRRALLAQTVRDLEEGQGAANKANYCDARRWVMTPGYGELGISFDDCCEALGIDPSYYRRGLVKRFGLVRP